MSASTTHQNAIVGTGRFRYEALARWEQLPPGWAFGEVAGVATDSRGTSLRFGPAPYLEDRQLDDAMAALGEVARGLGTT